MQSTNKYVFIDALRGLAILLVLWTHLSYAGFPTDTFNNLTAIGVSLFFMVSSYTLCLSEDYKVEKEGKFSWLYFWIRRIFRIFPLYYTIITGVTLITIINSYIHIIPLSIENSFLNFFTHYTFLFGFFPQYITFGLQLGERSLFNEMAFYLVFPLVFVLCRKSFKKSILLVFLGYLIYLLWGYIGKITSLHPTFISRFPLSNLMDFGLGFILYHAHKYFSNNSIKKIYPLILSFLLFILLFVGIFLIQKDIFMPKMYWLMQLFMLSLLSIIVHFVILNPQSSIIVNMILWLLSKGKKLLAFLGKISYSLYLINIPVLMFLGFLYTKFHISFFYLVFLTMSSLLGISIITYQVERRGILYGKRIIARLEQKNKNIPLSPSD